MAELRNLQRSDDDQTKSQKIGGSIQDVWRGFFHWFKLMIQKYSLILWKKYN